MSAHAELFKLALLQVSVSPSPWAAGSYFNQTLDLSTGTFSLFLGGANLSSHALHIPAYVDANADVLRVAAASYNADDIKDIHSHLTNHCIATTHAEYGKYEATNELFYAAFDQELIERYPELAAKAQGTPANGSVLESVVLPQVRRLVVQSMLAARERLASDGEYYQPFQLYGYDFLVDAELRVWLCEINASPAVADELLPDLVKALVRTAIDPICPPCVELMGAGASAQYDAEASAAAERGDVFETLYRSPPKEETP
jgi:hypothetical protein